MPSVYGLNLTQSLLERLGQSIVSGEYDREPFPTEAALAAYYGTSRTSLREAIKMLTAKGLLISRTRAGTIIQPVSNWNLLDPQILQWLLKRRVSPETYIQFAHVRLAFEPIAAGLAAEFATKADIRAIRDSFDQMMLAQNNDLQKIEHDIAFHGRILMASANPFFFQLKPLIDTALRFSISQTTHVNDPECMPNHLRVFLAIESRDNISAEEAMRALIRRAVKALQNTASTSLENTDKNEIKALG